MHGECLGDRGFWTKMVIYEEAASIPLIMTGPNISSRKEKAPVSLIELYPTILDITGLPHVANEAACLLSGFFGLARFFPNGGSGSVSV